MISADLQEQNNGDNYCNEHKDHNDPSWYAIYTRPKEEDRANSNLKAWGVETLYPRFKQRRHNQFSGSSHFVIKPLFNRYLFAQFNAESLLHKISFTRGVANVVCFGGKPVPLDDNMITAVRSRISDDGLVRIGGPLEKGDKVMIQDGPFKSFMGVFERETKAMDRVVILLSSVNFQSRVVIERSLVQKACA